MDLTSPILDTLDALTKIYCIICRKAYVTAQVQFVPQKGESGEVTNESIALTVINESGPEIDIQRVWFLTSFNRPIFSEFMDSRVPIKLFERKRSTYFIPMEELKAALNKNIGDTIIKAVVFDKTGHIHAGRVDKSVEEALAR